MQQMQMQDTYDYRQYDRVWQRVSPTLDPYPGMSGAAPAQMSAPAGPGAAGSSAAQGAPAMQGQPVMQGAPALPPRPAAQPLDTLPGAEADPCCMGSAAMEMIEVLQGFIEDELADRRYYRAFARQAPSWARQTLADTAEDEAGHARRLMAAYYLITGQCYRPNVVRGQLDLEDWCEALRQCYHEEACGGLNYARTADGTADICLAKLMNELSADEYRHAEQVMGLLERSLGRRTFC